MAKVCYAFNICYNYDYVGSKWRNSVPTFQFIVAATFDKKLRYFLANIWTMFWWGQCQGNGTRNFRLFPSHSNTWCWWCDHHLLPNFDNNTLQLLLTTFYYSPRNDSPPAPKYDSKKKLETKWKAHVLQFIIAARGSTRGGAHARYSMPWSSSPSASIRNYYKTERTKNPTFYIGRSSVSVMTWGWLIKDTRDVTSEIINWGNIFLISLFCLCFALYLCFLFNIIIFISSCKSEFSTFRVYKKIVNWRNQLRKL